MRTKLGVLLCSYKRIAQIWIEITETEQRTIWSCSTDGRAHRARRLWRGLLKHPTPCGVPDQARQNRQVDRTRDCDESKIRGVFRSSVQLAKALGAEVVAEGVETADQLEFIQRMGCKLVQGYFFFKPMPAKDCISHLERRLSPAA